MPFSQPGPSANANIGSYFDVAGNQFNYHSPVPPIDLIARLNPVLDAAYDCGPRADSRCFEGTRVEVVERIDKWAKDPSGRRIGWLKGPAGFGKSAIARTVAHRWNLAKLLAASFCFFRNAGNQSKGARLLPTLAFQLTLAIPETKQAIEDALVKDPMLLNRDLQQQFQRLLVDPISALPEQNRSKRFIVIDGLDECDDHDFITQLLELVTSIDYFNFPAQFLFTSRIDEHVRKAFERSTATNNMTYHLSLSDINATQDIRLFLRSRFDIIYTENPRLMANIPRPWPSESDLDEIVRKVNGSFIFASTLAKYIGSGRVPPERLKIVVESHTGVDGMYTEIIKEFWKDEHFPVVFSAIMLLEHPLSVTSLGSLLDLTSSQIVIEVLKLQSILIVPSDDRMPVDIVHTSLRDFSTTPIRAGNFCVDIPENHLLITECCLKVMLANSQQLVLEKDPAKYAAFHWHKHLLLTLNSPYSRDLQYDSLMDSLENFAKQAAYAWTNTFIYGRGNDRDSFVRDTVVIFKATPVFPPRVVEVIEQLRKLVEVRDTVPSSSLLIYGISR